MTSQISFTTLTEDSQEGLRLVGEFTSQEMPSTVFLYKREADGILKYFGVCSVQDLSNYPPVPNDTEYCNLRVSFARKSILNTSCTLQNLSEVKNEIVRSLKSLKSRWAQLPGSTEIVTI